MGLHVLPCFGAFVSDMVKAAFAFRIWSWLLSACSAITIDVNVWYSCQGVQSVNNKLECLLVAARTMSQSSAVETAHCALLAAPAHHPEGQEQLTEYGMEHKHADWLTLHLQA